MQIRIYTSTQSQTAVIFVLLFIYLFIYLFKISFKVSFKSTHIGGPALQESPAYKYTLKRTVKYKNNRECHRVKYIKHKM